MDYIMTIDRMTAYGLGRLLYLHSYSCTVTPNTYLILTDPKDGK
jgi:hypothetical protein